MLNFYNENFEIINSKIARSLITNLLDEVTITLKVRNDSQDQSFSSVGVFLKPSAEMGELSYLSNLTPEASYNEILNWGNDNKGLVLINENNEEFIFKINFGSDKETKILISDNLNPGQSVSFKVKLIKNQNAISQRLYIGLEVE